MKNCNINVKCPKCGSKRVGLTIIAGVDIFGEFIKDGKLHFVCRDFHKHEDDRYFDLDEEFWKNNTLYA